VVIQTRSSLILRDIDILRRAKDLEAGLTITTADDDIRRLFEPNAPPVKERLSTLDELHRSGVKTYAMIAPILPGAETLPNVLEGKVNYIIVDRMNYHYADWVYRKYGLADKLSDDFFQRTGRELASACKKLGIVTNLTF
jgi:DNA repair photolyase